MTSEMDEERAEARIAPLIDWTRSVQFTFEGRTYTGYEGDTLASALYRAGVRTFSRSFKYHRPRGLMCVHGSCPNCLVKLDDTPNVRACMTPLEAGMEVRGQNAWPSVENDLMSITDKMGRFLPVGFYYKMFIRPRSLWPAYETVLRHAAGLGTIDPAPDRFEEPYYDKQYRHAEVTVVGGGPAGLSAALAAADLGADVVLIDENQQLGGHLLYQRGTVPDTVLENTHYATGNTRSTSDLADELAKAARVHDNVDVLTGATAFGWYEDNLIGVSHGNRLIKLRTERLVVAAGRIEQPLVFENNDLPGVFLGSGLQRLMNVYGVHPGERALVVTANDYGWAVARDLLGGGVDVAMVVDARPEVPENEVAKQVRQAGVPGFSSHTIKAAGGHKAVDGAVVVRLDAQGNPVSGTEVELRCDVIGVSTAFVPNNGLLYQSGCELQYDPKIGEVVPMAFASGVRGAGHAVGTSGLKAILLDGRAAGLGAALSLDDPGDEEAKKRRARTQEQLDALEHPSRFRTMASAPGDGLKRVVCFCEDVTEKDLKDAVAEGFAGIETLKRYSTISMGPCQGKMCSMNAIRLCARETGRTVAETGTTTSRPPFNPVKLGMLAGRKLEPVRYTPLYHEHLALGAKMMNAGEWKRPEHYGDPAVEVQAVRERVGIIDVSTLGKINLFGPDAVELLERLYTNKFSLLDQGQVRYGVMCSDEGIIFDDGVVCRLDDDRYYLTTTSGGIQSVYEWLTWWLSTWDMRVCPTNVTESYGAINVAGPRARDLLVKLTNIDLSPEAFPYMQARVGTVAGVSTRLLRIGFVGELSYELHFSAEYGAYMWETLMEAGAEYGVKPFGIEAQRVLRLEKKHIIIGQDTDALSDPFGANMAWAVDLDKEDFLGKPSLARIKKRGVEGQLVAFEMMALSVVPGEGEQIVENGEIVGRVTSARYSPSLKKSIGMGWVSLDKAHEGAVLQIRTNGEIAHARVRSAPFYDPEGERLRM